jgi:hypothetical protein
MFTLDVKNSDVRKRWLERACTLVLVIVALLLLLSVREIVRSVLVLSDATTPEAAGVTELYVVAQSYGASSTTTGATTTFAYAVRNRTGTDRQYLIEGVLEEGVAPSTALFSHDEQIMDGEERLFEESFYVEYATTSVVRVSLPTLQQALTVRLRPPE